VLITIPAKAVSLTTDAEGRALKLQLAEGEYEVKAIKAGYVEWKQTIQDRNRHRKAREHSAGAAVSSTGTRKRKWGSHQKKIGSAMQSRFLL
jgi:hypothetical protein